MIPFSSIVEHLQVKIAEKLRYVDQMEFEMSSKRGKHVANATQFKPVVEVHIVDMDYTDVILDVQPGIQGNSRKPWSKLRGYQHLPRFKVSRLKIWEGAQPDTIIELGEKLKLIDSKVHLHWKKSVLSVENFLKLSEVFAIKGLTYRASKSLSPEFFKRPEFLEMEFLEIPISNTNVETLLQLKAQSLIFMEFSECHIDVIANLFIQKWFLKERNVDWFRIVQNEEIPNNKEKLLSQLPGKYEIVWQGNETSRNKTKITFFDTKDSAKQYGLKKDDLIVSLDRGDKKLLILISMSCDLVVAQEYIELKDIMHIEEIEEGKRREITRKRTRNPDN